MLPSATTPSQVWRTVSCALNTQRVTRVQRTKGCLSLRKASKKKSRWQSLHKLAECIGKTLSPPSSRRRQTDSVTSNQFAACPVETEAHAQRRRLLWTGCWWKGTCVREEGPPPKGLSVTKSAYLATRLGRPSLAQVFSRRRRRRRLIWQLRALSLMAILRAVALECRLFAARVRPADD